MIRKRTGKSSIILGFTKMLELALIDCLHRAIAISWLNVIHIWLLVPTNHHKLLTLISVLDFIGSHSVVPATFCLIFPHSSVFSVRCLLMPTCLQPTIIHIAAVPMNHLIGTHYNFHWNNLDQLPQGV